MENVQSSSGAANSGQAIGIFQNGNSIDWSRFNSSGGISGSQVELPVVTITTPNTIGGDYTTSYVFGFTPFLPPQAPEPKKVIPVTKPHEQRGRKFRFDED